MYSAFKSANKEELLRYFFAGLTAVCTDLLVYSLLLRYVWPSVAKTISFISATIIAYLLQKFWTFKRKEHSWSEMMKFGSVYGVSLFANVAVNSIVRWLCMSVVVQLSPVQYHLGWLAATGTSTILNYIGQKYWVFKTKVNDQPALPDS
ncbi:MAG TPA: GtrA family protein [Planktothrix sp.]|jgi:putative flippase GtrA